MPDESGVESSISRDVRAGAEVLVAFLGRKGEEDVGCGTDCLGISLLNVDVVLFDAMMCGLESANDE